ncbi:MAG: hypothetical protein GQ574_08375 [Crocinitomix sp.]|nr:hypothetical protein [Crocinitomix sp.]
MKDQSKSSFIFELIEEFDIFDKSGKPNEFTDEGYNLFCEKYQTKTALRDSALLNYLRQTPNLFRSHIPHSRYAFSVVLNVVWYYDELIINDPVLELIKSEGTLERKKIALRETLSFLKDIKDSIQGGYILFAGDSLVPKGKDKFKDESSILIQQAEVLSEFEKISAFLTKPTQINENVEDVITQIEIIYNGLKGEVRQLGSHIPTHLNKNLEKFGSAVTFDFVSPKNRISKKDFMQYRTQDMFESLNAEYRVDISTVLEAITNAQQLNSPVLFYRNVDKVVAQHYSAINSNSKVNEAVYNCAAPYFEEIDPQRLFDIREKIPNAFIDFRSFLFDLVKEAIKRTNDPAELDYLINSKINPLLRGLNVEMANAKRRFNFQGVATPLIMATGSLGLFALDVDFSSLLAAVMGSGGGVQTVKSFGTKISNQEQAKLNPMYFLWQAQQGKKNT